MMLYLDYAATTPPYREVVDTVSEVMGKYYGNPSSIHGIGMEAERLIMQSRENIAAILQAKPSEIVFTSCGTESNNMAIKGAALQYRNRGNHLITSEIEHPSVAETFRQLEGMGFRVTVLPVDGTGQVCLDALREALSEDTILVSIMYVNNETGRIQPIEEIGKILSAYPKICFHVDAVQGVGKLPVHPERMGIDLLSASAHKFRGPKGVGFLYKKEGVQLQPLLAGGGQEHGLRSGTENVPLIVGMAKALRMATEKLDEAIERKKRFRRILAEGVASIPQLVMNGSDKPDDMAPHIFNFSFPGMKSEVVVHALEKHGIYISTRSACASGEEKPSKVLLAMGYDRARAVSGLRISFSEEHTEEDARFVVAKLKQVVEEFKPFIHGGSPAGRRSS
jgi:cysteine desulfurase